MKLQNHHGCCHRPTRNTVKFIPRVCVYCTRRSQTHIADRRRVVLNNGPMTKNKVRRENKFNTCKCLLLCRMNTCITCVPVCVSGYAFEWNHRKSSNIFSTSRSTRSTFACYSMCGCGVLGERDSAASKNTRSDSVAIPFSCVQMRRQIVCVTS